MKKNSTWYDENGLFQSKYFPEGFRGVTNNTVREIWHDIRAHLNKPVVLTRGAEHVEGSAERSDHYTGDAADGRPIYSERWDRETYCDVARFVKSKYPDASIGYYRTSGGTYLHLHVSYTPDNVREWFAIQRYSSEGNLLGTDYVTFDEW